MNAVSDRTKGRGFQGVKASFFLHPFVSLQSLRGNINCCDAAFFTAYAHAFQNILIQPKTESWFFFPPCIELPSISGEEKTCVRVATFNVL